MTIPHKSNVGQGLAPAGIFRIFQLTVAMIKRKFRFHADNCNNFETILKVCLKR